MTAETGPEGPSTGWASSGGPVVVGIDGGRRSIGALRWAAAEAAHRGVELRAVHACGPEPTVAPYAPVHPAVPGPESVLHVETGRLAAVVREALGPRPGVPVRQVCEPTTPIRALLAHGQGASLLVLATSIDRTTGDEVGATALACVRHPPCPVVVVPEHSRDR